MAIKIIKGSHLDHGLTSAQFEHIYKRFEDRKEFFIETFELPPELGLVDCNLIGPAVQMDPVGELDVRYIVRTARNCASRVHTFARAHKTRLLTVIAGPTDESGDLSLFTAYGGPAAPREPGDPTLANWDEVMESRAFWGKHALVCQ